MRQVLSRQVLGKGMLTAAAASSLLSIVTGAASAHSGAVSEASHSPGVLSGNSVSAPIDVSPNVCGNSVDGGAALNPAFGNSCVTSAGSDARQERHALPEQRREESSHVEALDEECDDQPHTLPAPAPQPRPAAQHPAPRPAPAAEIPAPPQPAPAPAEEAPHTLPAPAPVEAPHTLPAPAPAEEAPHTLPAPAPVEAPHTLPAPAPAEEAPHTLPAPAPVEAPHTLPAPAPALAETGAGQAGAAAILASTLALGGAILYRRSRIA